MLYREIIAVCPQIHPKHINNLCGQNGEFLNIKPGGTYGDNSSCNIPCRKVKPVGLPAPVRLHCLQFFHPAMLSFFCRFVSSYSASQYCSITCLFKVFHLHSSVTVHSFTQHQEVVTFWNYSLFGICPSFRV